MRTNVTHAIVLSFGFAITASVAMPSDALAGDLLGRATELAVQTTAAQAAGDQPAGPALDLTLDAAVARALDQNLDIQVVRLNPTAIDFTTAQIRAAYRPVFFSSYGRRNATALPTSQLVGGAKVQNDFTTYNFSTQQLLPAGGGSYSVAWNNNRIETNSTFASFNPSFTSNLAFAISQPLLKNFAIDTTRQQLQITRLSREISDIQVRATVTNTIANVKNAYWDLVYATENLDVQRRTLALNQELLDSNRERVRAGAMAPADVVQSEVEVARARQSFASAQATLESAEVALKRLIVSDPESSLWNTRIRPVDRPPIESVHPDVRAAIGAALKKRTDLEQLRRVLGQTEVNQRYYGNQKLPQVDLVAGYEADGLGGTQIQREGLGNAVIGTVPGGFGDALHAIRRLEFPTWTAQVNVTYPIGSNASDAALARARVQAEQTRVQLKQAEVQVSSDIRQAAISVENALKQVETSRIARELSERRLQAEQEKFEVGISSSFFVVQAQRDLTDARNAELFAQLAYRKAIVNFERLQDTTLQGAGVSLAVN